VVSKFLILEARSTLQLFGGGPQHTAGAQKLTPKLHRAPLPFSTNGRTSQTVRDSLRSDQTQAELRLAVQPKIMRVAARARIKSEQVAVIDRGACGP
jgi:hypothetical protein